MDPILLTFISISIAITIVAYIVYTNNADTESQTQTTTQLELYPINGKLLEWTNEGSCFKDTNNICKQKQVRGYIEPQNGGTHADGYQTRVQYIPCNTCSTPQPAAQPASQPAAQPAAQPVNGKLLEWTDEGGCFKDANNVCLKKQVRGYIEPQNGGTHADGYQTRIQYVSCSTCPEDGWFTPWTNVGACELDISNVCNQKRTRSYVHATNGGKDVDNYQNYTTESYTPCSTCKKDATLSPWENKGTCARDSNNVCKQRRERIYTPPENGGTDIVGDKSTVSFIDCSTCPIDGVLSQWSNVGNCTLNADEECLQKQTRSYTPAQYGGITPIGWNNTEQWVECNTCIRNEFIIDKSTTYTSANLNYKSTMGWQLRLLSNGNLVITNPSGVDVWETNTLDKGECTLILDDYNGIMLKNSSNTTVCILRMSSNATKAVFDGKTGNFAFYQDNVRLNDIFDNTYLDAISTDTKIFHTGVIYQVFKFFVDNNNYIELKSNGELVVNCSGKYWSNRSYAPSSIKQDFTNPTLRMQYDGNLVIYDGNRSAKWATHTDRRYSTIAAYTKSRFALYSVWTSKESIPWDSPDLKINATDAFLFQSGYEYPTTFEFKGSDGREIRFQDDGNFIIYANNGATPLWATSTYNKGAVILKMQDDGNLVMYKSDGSVLWSSATYGNPGAYAVYDRGTLYLMKGSFTTFKIYPA